MKVYEIIDRLIKSFPEVRNIAIDITRAFEVLQDCYKNGGKLLVCGNGGSASDAEHIVGELMKGFNKKRSVPLDFQKRLDDMFPQDSDFFSSCLQQALPAISLVSHTSLITAYINDINADMVFAQQVYGYGKEGDVLLAISTSGNSKNVINAVKIANALSMKSIGLTGGSGGSFKGLCDVTITAPANETHKIQEYHLPIYHALCAMLETQFFNDC